MGKSLPPESDKRELSLPAESLPWKANEKLDLPQEKRSPNRDLSLPPESLPLSDKGELSLPAESLPRKANEKLDLPFSPESQQKLSHNRDLPLSPESQQRLSENRDLPLRLESQEKLSDKDDLPPPLESEELLSDNLDLPLPPESIPGLLQVEINELKFLLLKLEQHAGLKGALIISIDNEAAFALAVPSNKKVKFGSFVFKGDEGEEDELYEFKVEDEPVLREALKKAKWDIDGVRFNAMLNYEKEKESKEDESKGVA